MQKLTNYQRAILVNLWIKKGREGELEAFIGKVCQQKDIEYTPPKKERPEKIKVLPLQVDMFHNKDDS